jgi:hypothetical protein
MNLPTARIAEGSQGKCQGRRVGQPNSTKGREQQAAGVPRASRATCSPAPPRARQRELSERRAARRWVRCGDQRAAARATSASCCAPGIRPTRSRLPSCSGHRGPRCSISPAAAGSSRWERGCGRSRGPVDSSRPGSTRCSWRSSGTSPSTASTSRARSLSPVSSASAPSALALFFDRAVQQGPGAARQIGEELRARGPLPYPDLLRAYAALAAERFRRTSPPASPQERLARRGARGVPAELGRAGPSSLESHPLPSQITKARGDLGTSLVRSPWPDSVDHANFGSRFRLSGLVAVGAAVRGDGWGSPHRPDCLKRHIPRGPIEARCSRHPNLSNHSRPVLTEATPVNEEPAFSLGSACDQGSRRDGLDPIIGAGLPGIGPELMRISRVV